MSIAAYRKCLNALDVAAMQHPTPEGEALVASVRQIIHTFMAAEDPSLTYELLIGPPAKAWCKRYPNKQNCGFAARRAGRSDRT